MLLSENHHSSAIQALQIQTNMDVIGHKMFLHVDCRMLENVKNVPVQRISGCQVRHMTQFTVKTASRCNITISYHSKLPFTVIVMIQP